MTSITKTEKTYPKPELRGSLKHLKYPALVEAKLDGMLCWYVQEKLAHTHFITPSGKKEDGGRPKKEYKSLQILGEMCVGKGLKGDFYKLRKKGIQRKFYAIDIYELNGEILVDKTLEERKDILAVVAKGWHQSSLHSIIANTEEEVVRYFYEAIEAGYEGIVAKSLDERLIFGPCNWVKLKLKDRSTFLVCKIHPDRERIEVRVKGPHIIKDVGVKVSDEIKKTLKLGDLIDIEYQGILETGGLRHPVFIKKNEDENLG